LVMALTAGTMAAHWSEKSTGKRISSNRIIPHLPSSLGRRFS
jgi:hypothetical protein